MRSLPLVLAISLYLPARAGGQSHPPPTVTRVADGIYLFVTAPYGDVGLDGNSVAIVSDQGVLVFDSNGTPAAARAVLGEIRKLTDRPVRYLIHSHWHWDHWYGAQVYRDAFPDLVVITHERTRQLMAGPAIEFNRPGLERQLPAHVDQLEQRLRSAPAELRARLEAHLRTDRSFLEEKRSVRHLLASLTFRDALTIHLGEREVRVLHHDRAVTPGDAYLHLPRERIVITGDLLINPISFALSSYPSGWLRTLRAIDRLDPVVIVPGHGAMLRDRRLLDGHIALFAELLEKGKSAKARGLDVEAAKAAILPGLDRLRRQFTGGDAALGQQFEVYLVDWYLHRVYDEVDGRLSDAIAPIPEH